VTLAFGVAASSLAEQNRLRPVLIAGAWRQLDAPLWWMSGALITFGAVVVLASAQLAGQESAGIEGRTWRMFLTSSTPAGLVGRAAVLAVSGTALIARPAVVLRLAAGVVGLVLVLFAVRDLLAARSAAASSGGLRIPRRLAVPLAILPPALVLLAMLSVNAEPGERRILPPPTQAGACNGHRALCDRAYDEVAFPATHNSMTAVDENWFLPEQPTGVVGQLDDGIRVFLIDSWYGQTTARGVVATAAGSRPAALAEANATYGPEVVKAALRVRDAASLKPTGPRVPYLCHALCELGATRWDSEMTAVRQWVVAHPRDVVTFFVQDEVTPADTDTVFRTAGLLPYVHTQLPGQPWPTLGQMIDSGRRVVVLMEQHGGGTQYPWLLQGFDWVQDTPYANPTVANLTCRLERGSPTDTILLINHWLGGVTSLVTDARKINARDVLLPELRRCESERGQLPNFVAVNFYDLGDLFSVINTLNGF
jgi:hypothetical protein